MQTKLLSKFAIFPEVWVGVQDCCVRLAVLQQAQCPNWHTDAVMLRLLITYQGEGTQYLQTGLGSNACQVVPQHIALLKGSAWSDKSMAIVHRSPPSLARRVVLTLDPL